MNSTPTNRVVLISLAHTIHSGYRDSVLATGDAVAALATLSDVAVKTRLGGYRRYDPRGVRASSHSKRRKG